MLKLPVYLVLGFCLACGVTRSAKADDVPTATAFTTPTDPEIIRKKLIAEITHNSSVSANVKAHVLPLLKNDSLPIPTLDMGTMAMTDKDSEGINQGYITVLLFRYRQHPEHILHIYNTLSPDYRAELIVLSDIIFPCFLSSSYEPLAERAFSDKVAQTNLDLTDNKTGYTTDATQYYLELGYLHATQNAHTIPAILKEIRTQIVDADQRFNIVSYIASEFGASSEPIVRWYFENYAVTPFEVKMCLDSLKKSEGKETFRRLLQAHLTAFQNTFGSLATGVKIGTTVYAEWPTSVLGDAIPDQMMQTQIEKGFSQSAISKQARAKLLAGIRSSNSHFVASEIKALYSGQENDSNKVIRHLTLYVWLFRLRYEPQKLVSLYSLVPASSRQDLLLLSSSYFKQYVGPNYEPLGLAALRDWEADAGTSHVDTSISEFHHQIIQYLKFTKSPLALPDAQRELEARIVNADVRRALVEDLSEVFGRDTLDTSLLYYQQYAKQPDEILFFNQYFRQYLAADSAEGLIQQKQQDLQQDAALFAEYLLK